MTSFIKNWFWMFVVIISETTATSILKMFDNSGGTIKAVLLLSIIILYSTSYYCLTYVVKKLPVGIAYATWSGSGVILVSIWGIVFYGQYPDLGAVIGMTVIASGIIIMNLFSKMGESNDDVNTINDNERMKGDDVC